MVDSNAYMQVIIIIISIIHCSCSRLLVPLYHLVVEEGDNVREKERHICKEKARKFTRKKH